MRRRVDASANLRAELAAWLREVEDQYFAATGERPRSTADELDAGGPVTLPGWIVGYYVRGVSVHTPTVIVEPDGSVTVP